MLSILVVEAFENIENIENVSFREVVVAVVMMVGGARW